jgi:hypothetical protein
VRDEFATEHYRGQGPLLRVRLSNLSSSDIADVIRAPTGASSGVGAHFMRDRRCWILIADAVRSYRCFYCCSCTGPIQPVILTESPDRKLSLF